MEVDLHSVFFFALLLLTKSGLKDASNGSSFQTLWLYDGSWELTPGEAEGERKAERLTNDCAAFHKYFACQQDVNGNVSGLLIFVPASKADEYYTQTITPDGRATGRASLSISGNQWIFLSRWDQGAGRTTYYRTTNVFNDKNHIHFEQSESSDDVHWTTKHSGDEVRIDAGRSSHQTPK